MGDDERHRDGNRKRPTNVVRLPRDWLGPREDLVPLRLRDPSGADDRDAAVLEFPRPPSPSHDDFWGGTPDAIPDPVVAPDNDAPDEAQRGAAGLGALDKPEVGAAGTEGERGREAQRSAGVEAEHHDTGAVTPARRPADDWHRGTGWARVGVMAVLAALVVMFARHVGDRQGARVAARAITTPSGAAAHSAAARAAITFPPSLSTASDPAMLSAHVSPRVRHVATDTHRRPVSSRRRGAVVRRAPRQSTPHAGGVTGSVVTAIAPRAPQSATPPATASAARATSVSSATSPAASTYSTQISSASSRSATTTYHPASSAATSRATTSASHESGPVGAGAPFGPGVQVG